jgi:hypothetical protein
LDAALGAVFSAVPQKLAGHPGMGMGMGIQSVWLCSENC